MKKNKKNHLKKLIEELIFLQKTIQAIDTVSERFYNSTDWEDLLCETEEDTEELARKMSRMRDFYTGRKAQLSILLEEEIGANQLSKIEKILNTKLHTIYSNECIEQIEKQKILQPKETKEEKKKVGKK